MAYLEIRKGIFHVGDPTTQNGLNCNPYLLVDGDEAILIDPGSPLDFQIVLANVKKIVALEQISYIILHHQDPDFCSSVPLFEKEGVKAQLITSWRAMTLIQFYGVKSPYYLIEEQQMRLNLKSGRTISFISTPYLHFAGAFVSYDETTKSLFSSDLFGAFSYNPTLFADDQYLNKMQAFHEHYMPSNAILRPIMDILSLYPIDVIMPQHGSIINSGVSEYIDTLKNLECGSLLTPVKKNLMQSGGFLMIFSELYQRIASLYPKEDVDDVFTTIASLKFNDKNEIISYVQEGNLVWNTIFSVIKEKKGVLWLSVLEPFVQNLCTIYDLEIPEVLNNTLNEIVTENKKLHEINQALDQTIKSANDRLIKCKITGLYNEAFFHSIFTEELEKEDWRDLGSLVCINIDNFADYKIQYGPQEERTVLVNMAYMLKEEFGNNSVYRLDGSDFGLYIKMMKKQELINKVDLFRMGLLKSDFFIGNLSISAGIAFANELELDAPTIEITIEKYQNLAFDRLRNAELAGKNTICFEGSEIISKKQKKKVLIADTDSTNILLLKTFFEQDEIEVLSCDNGIDGVELAIEHLPEVIISEIMLNKLDGFGFREKLLNHSKTKDLEFILLSHKKDDENVERAFKLDITHFIRKPYSLVELLGIAKRIIRG